MSAEPVVTYEVWSRNVQTGEARRRPHEIGFPNAEVPQLLADHYNADFKERMSMEAGGPVQPNFDTVYFVVEATTTFRELSPEVNL